MGWGIDLDDVRPKPKKRRPEKGGILGWAGAGASGPQGPVGDTGSPPSGSTRSAPPRRVSGPTAPLLATGLSSKYVLNQLDDLLSPGPTARETAEVAVRLGVRPNNKSVIAEAGEKASDVASDAIREISRGAEKAAREFRKLPSKKVDNVAGVKTLGTPTVGQLLKAAAQTVAQGTAPRQGNRRMTASTVVGSSSGTPRRGGLQINRKGKLTIPATRQAARQLSSVRARARRVSGPLPGLDPGQTRLVRTVLRVGDKMGATPKEKLAAVETALVESNARNLGYGDADSEGWRQERTSIYGTGPTGPRNVRASARRFFEESVSDTGGSRGAGLTAGQLAQTIQDSAFPERYDEQKAVAAPILAAYERGGVQPGSGLARELKVAEAQARSLGIPVGEAAKLGPPPKRAVTRFKAAIVAAKELEKAGLPYVWGGGHGDPASRPTGGGLDCSGAVSFVLNKMGVMDGALVSGSMGQVLEPGPGAVTVFYNPTHTFMKIGKRYFGTSRTNPGGGAGWIEGTPDDLSKYSVGHVPGMGGKVALQMGIPLTGGGSTEGGGGSFPGMELSADGTTARVVAGQKKEDVGYSAAPILFSAAVGARAAMPSAVEPGPDESEAEGSEGGLGGIEEMLRRRRVRT